MDSIPRNKTIKIYLAYIDVEELIHEKLSFLDVENYLKPFWSDTKNPDKINREHCPSCPYNNICHK